MLQAKTPSHAQANRSGRVLLLLLTAWTFLAASAARGAEPAGPPMLRLQIVTDGWGGAAPADVRKVLESAGGALATNFRGVEIPPIQISPRGGPIVLHQRLSDGTIQVRLDTGGNYWSQYAFQFGHELCHILCRYDQDPTGNLWFEESICEMASLFVLRRMSETWRTEPPYPTWKPYADNLATYARDYLDQARLPPGETLATWYLANAGVLAKTATDRERNRVVAVALLTKFEAQPESWNAVHFLNVATPAGPQRFADYLGDWHANVPPEQRKFVTSIAAEFGIEILAK